MTAKKRVDRVGPEPIPEHLYASRQLPVRRVLLIGGRLFVVLLVVCTLIGLFVMSLYQLPIGGSLLRSIGTVLPVPAIRVNSTNISYRAYQTVLDGWSELYQQKGATDDTNKDALKERITERMIQEVLLIDLAEELHLRVQQTDVESVRRTFIDQYEDEARYEAALYEQFRWTPEQFTQFVTEPLARIRVLDEAILHNEEMQDPPRTVIAGIHEEITRDPEQFSTLAVQVSGSLSAIDGGELGLRPLDDYPTEAQQVLRTTSEGGVTEVIELADRFIFYRVLEQDATQGVTLVNAQELSVAKRDVYDVLNDRRAKANVTYYMKP